MPPASHLNSASFRMPWYYRVFMFGICGAVAAICVGFSIAKALGVVAGFPLLLLGWWWLSLCWFSYWLLFRTCHRIDFADGAVHWSTPLRSGWLPVTEIRGARPAFEWMYRRRLANLDWSTWYDRKFMFIEAIDRAVGRPLLVLVDRRTTNELAFFLDKLQQYVPDAPMRYGQPS